MTQHLRSLSVLAAVAVACLASAGLTPPLAYEGMEPSSGPLDNLATPGSFGWNGPWDIQNNESNNFKFVPESLTYGPLEVTGNKALVGGGWLSGGRPFETKGQGVFDNNGFCSDAWTAGLIDQKSVWVSYLVQYTGSNTDIRITLGQNNVAWFSDQSAVQVGRFSGSPVWEARVNNAIATNQQNYSAPQSLSTDLLSLDTRLVVINVDNDAGTVKVWMNPPFSSLGTTPPAPNATFLDVNFGGRAFKAFSFYPSNSAVTYLDEIRVGDSWAVVTPASQAPSITLTGTVTLNDFDPAAVAGQRVELILTKDGGSALPPAEVILGAGGSYSLPVAEAGTYSVRAKGSHWLGQRKTGVSVSSSGGTADFSLINGDVDGDNSITVFDYDRLSAAFDATPSDPSWDVEADLDGDGTVTVFDYDILSTNFDLVGD